MISVLPLSAVDCGFEPQLGQTIDNKVVICCLFVKWGCRGRMVVWFITAYAISVYNH
jgi:hypothetical protein